MKATVAYVIEYLNSDGWVPLRENTRRTGFVLRQVRYATREEAEASICSPSQWRGVLVVETEDPPDDKTAS